MRLEMENSAQGIQRTDRIELTAGKGTNLFNSMPGSYRCGDFPYCRAVWEGDFRARCKVTVDFRAVYDLGCLVVYENEEKWLKLAFENSDASGPAIVSIVTDGTSDDCNGSAISGKSVWLQICRKGDVFAMHHSLDGVSWKLARIFKLAMAHDVKVGVSAQCPSGESCTAVFERLEITENPYENMRLAK